MLDRFNNFYSVVYFNDPLQGRFDPHYIQYEPDTQVRFHYRKREAAVPSLTMLEGLGIDGYRPGLSWGYQSGSLHKQAYLLDKITTHIETINPNDISSGTVVRQYGFEYEQGAQTGQFHLSRLTDCGFEGTTKACTRASTFEWQTGQQGFDAPVALNLSKLVVDPPRSVLDIKPYNPQPMIVDLNNDGYPDLVWVKDFTWWIGKGSATGYEQINTGVGVGAKNIDAGVARIIKLDDRYGLLVGEFCCADSVFGVTTMEVNWSILTFDLDTPGQFEQTPLTMTRTISTGGKGREAAPIVLDFNRDGRDDILITEFVANSISTGETPVHLFLRKDAAWQTNGNNFDEVVTHVKGDPGAGFSAYGASLVDHDGDGLVDVLFKRSKFDGTSVGPRLFRNTGANLELNSQWQLPVGDGEEVAENFRISFTRSKTNGRPILRTTFTTTRNYAINITNPNLGDGTLVDLNGDSLPDYVLRVTDEGKSEGSLRYYMNMGGGKLSAPVDTGISMGSYKNQIVLLMDYDRDGLIDLITQNTQGTAWRVLLTTQVVSSGVIKPHFTQVNIDPFHGQLNHLLNFDKTQATDRMPLIVDVNNDAVTDVLYDVGGSWYVMYGKAEPPDLLKKISNGFGESIEFRYSALDATQVSGQPVYTHEKDSLGFPAMNLIAGQQVVNQTIRSNGIGGFSNHYYTYRGARVHLQGRGFLGFTQRSIKEAETGIATKITHHQHFPYLNTQLERKYDVKSGQLVTVSHSKKSYDMWGALTSKIQTIGTGSDGVGVTNVNRKITTINTVNNNSVDWLLGFVTQQQNTYSDVVGATNKTIINTYASIPGTLALQTSTKNVGSTSSELSTLYQRDVHGQIISKQVSGSGLLARSPKTYSNYLNNVYPQTSKNALGHATTLEYDRRFGELKSVTNPNGLFTKIFFDPIGRVVSTLDSDGAQTDTAYQYCSNRNDCPANAVYTQSQTYTHSAMPGVLGSPDTTEYYDLFDRILRTSTDSFSGDKIFVDQIYDHLGQIAKVSNPYFASTHPTAWTTYQYDLIGRMTQEVRPDGGVTEIEYSATPSSTAQEIETTTVIRPDGSRVTRVASRIYNGLMQVTRALDAEGSFVDFMYDAQGHLRWSRLNNNIETTVNLQFDEAGNKTELIDPSIGKITYRYNAQGEVVEQTDANNSTTTFVYDLLGRLAQRTDRHGVSQWVYDEGLSALGELSRVTGNGLTQSYLYDNQSRIKQVDTTIKQRPNQIYSEHYSYDVFGRSEAATYPSGFFVKNHYNPKGYLAAIDDASGKRLWSIGNMDFFGNITHESYGNTTASIRLFNPLSGNLQTQTTGRGTAANLLDESIQKLGYFFDTTGNLTQRISERLRSERIEESFTYDSRNRLIAAVTSGLVSGNRNLNYQYDDLGNITNKSDVGIYRYGRDCVGGGFGPNAVCETQGTITDNYRYDAVGNLIQNGTKNITYTAFNKPSEIKEGRVVTKFEYGPDQNRYYQHATEEGKTVETIYLANGAYEEIIDSSLPVVIRKSTVQGLISHHQEEDTQTSLVSSTLQYLHRDHLGSVESISNEQGGIITRTLFDPFGYRRKSNGETINESDWEGIINDALLTTSRGFTDHEQIDRHKLIHMNGRMYDPILGRFVSADVYIQSPFNVQSYNRYSYVINNPLSYTDPTGFKRDAGQHCMADPFCTISYISKDGLKQLNAALQPEISTGFDSFGLAVTIIAETSYSGKLYIGQSAEFGFDHDVITASRFDFESNLGGGTEVAAVNPTLAWCLVSPAACAVVVTGTSVATYLATPAGQAAVSSVIDGVAASLSTNVTPPHDEGPNNDDDKYENPGHHDPRGGPNAANSSKSTLPRNHQELWNKSIKTNNKTRWAKEGTGKNATYHRFQNDGRGGSFHWNGSTASGARSIPRHQVPNKVIKL